MSADSSKWYVRVRSCSALKKQTTSRTSSTRHSWITNSWRFSNRWVSNGSYNNFVSPHARRANQRDVSRVRESSRMPRGFRRKSAASGYLLFATLALPKCQSVSRLTLRGKMRAVNRQRTVRKRGGHRAGGFADTVTDTSRRAGSRSLRWVSDTLTVPQG